LTTQPQKPGIHENPEPCWTVLNENGEGAGYEGVEHHSRTREEAEKDHAGYTDPDTGENTTRVVQAAAPCWTGTLLCGKPFIFYGDVEAAHFADQEDLLGSAAYQGNQLTDGGALLCGDQDEDCEVCAPERRRIKQHLATISTRADVFTRGVAEGWADPITDPTQIDWTQRRKTALLGFTVEDGRPVNPWGRHLPYGRGELGHWGERANADAVVFATYRGDRVLLLGERRDGYGWAFPGGGINPDETVLEAALRELAEETGLRIDPAKPGTFHSITAHRPRHVRDPRATREAWMVTAPIVFELGDVAKLPELECGSDLARAGWVMATEPEQVPARVAELGGEIFEAHRQMITNAVLGALS